FHRRYMGSNRAARLWVDMVRELDPLMVVPQHGMPLKGEAMQRMLDWLSRLQRAIDPLGPQDHRAPARGAAAGPAAGDGRAAPVSRTSSNRSSGRSRTRP